jgi:hypothetical protein
MAVPTDNVRQDSKRSRMRSRSNCLEFIPRRHYLSRFCVDFSAFLDKFTGFFLQTNAAPIMISRRSINQPREAKPFTPHLVDGTYEVFRHFYRVKGFASRGLVGLF